MSKRPPADKCRMPTPAVVRQMEKAAELRAGGASWPAVAAELKRHLDTCRKWPQNYPELWDRLLRAAVRATEADARSEGILALRTLLRTKEDKLRVDVAKSLVAACKRAAPAEPAERTDDNLVEFARYLGTLTDEQLVALTNEIDPPDDPAKVPCAPDEAGEGRPA